VNSGEILGIGGLVGAGRTELMRLIIGANLMDSGEMLYNRKPIKIKSPKKALKMGIGLVPEDRKGEGIVSARSVLENMSYSIAEKSSHYSIVNWRGLKKHGIKLFTDLNVQPKNPHKSIQLLSGGNQQKAVLGKLLNADCRLLLLDEPTRGVDVGAREEIYKVINKLKEKGTAILMVSSDLIELISQSDRIAVMAKGKIVKEFSKKDATEENILEAALNLGGE
jgi:ribose transport system ATP-binding protein